MVQKKNRNGNRNKKWEFENERKANEYFGDMSLNTFWGIKESRTAERRNTKYSSDSVCFYGWEFMVSPNSPIARNPSDKIETLFSFKIFEKIFVFECGGLDELFRNHSSC
jgi:hypothetical protein